MFMNFFIFSKKKIKSKITNKIIISTFFFRSKLFQLFINRKMEKAINLYTF